MPLLGRGPSRCYLLNLCGGAWTRTPPRFVGAPARFFPTNIGLTSHATSSARWDYHHSSNFSDEPISGLQSFRDVQAPPLARPPGCSYRRSTPSSGQPGRIRHAMPMWLPNTDCGIATCLNRAIDTTGLSPARLRPFRPLHARLGSALRLGATLPKLTSSRQRLSSGHSRPPSQGVTHHAPFTPTGIGGFANTP
jgi:hypothetical protein